MPGYTTFLNLTLPELNEFVDSWDQPLNQNFEDLDDWLSDLYENLVGTGTGSTWSALRGSLNSLAARLAVSINTDGSINVSGSSEILDMATSAYRGAFSSPRDRLNDIDREIYEARQPFAPDRFQAMAGGAPTAGYPYEELDSGIAFRSADFGWSASKPIATPLTPWAPGLVAGGGSPLLSAGAGTNRVELSGATPAVFNIDGYIFRIRETILFDFNNLAPTGGVDYVWLYVSRDSGDYNDANFLYSESGGSPVQKDLRKLKTGADGVSSTSTFTSATGTFQTAPFRVQEGDILVVESPAAAAGSYVVDSVDSNTQLTIKGEFKADLASIAFHVWDPFMPNIGAAIGGTTTEDLPWSESGRVYIGRVLAGAPVTNVETFAKNGVYDSGWQATNAATLASGVAFTHSLGVVPSHVEVWVRETTTSAVYQPVVERQLATQGDDPADETTMLLPSMRHYADSSDVNVVALNASTVPAAPVAMFTDSGGTDVTSGYIRVIARR